MTSIKNETKAAEARPISPDSAPRPGLYQHYRGQRYQVIDLVHHTETDEPLVLYRALYGAEGLWVRPLALFKQPITIDGIAQPRFRYLGDE